MTMESPQYAASLELIREAQVRIAPFAKVMDSRVVLSASVHAEKYILSEVQNSHGKPALTTRPRRTRR